MNDELTQMTWREQGVTNWARDCGFAVTKESDLYQLSGRDSNDRILADVELAEIERYLENL